MKFVLLDDGGEIRGYDLDFLPWEEMTQEEREKTLLAWFPDPGVPLQ